MITIDKTTVESLNNKTIGELVAEDLRKADVFKKYGIDFCCKGNVTIEAACEKKNIDSQALKHDLIEIDNKNSKELDNYSGWDLSDLSDHIVTVHHAYVVQSLPIINEFMIKVCKVHGAHNPELYEISKYFGEVAAELTSHMPKEECMLFPYIKEMNIANKTNTPLAHPGFGTIKNPIRMMEEEHVSAGNNMEKVRELADNFTPPAHACATYKVLFFKLEEFETDLHQHIHLENNILFKKAIELEEKLFKK